MRTRIVTVLLGAALAFLLVTHPVVAEAARKITGRDIKNNSVTSADIRNGSLTGKDVKNQGLTGGDIKIGTLISADVKDNNLRGKDVRDDTLTGADVDESTLGRVPSAATADALSVLPSGESQSGMYSMAGGETDGGYIGDGITFPRPLAEPIEDLNIIDAVAHPDPANCPGAGQAAPGYLCLYSNFHDDIFDIYGYSDGVWNAPHAAAYDHLGVSVGLTLYAQVPSGTDRRPYADGVWTVTAP